MNELEIEKNETKTVYCTVHGNLKKSEENISSISHENSPAKFCNIFMSIYNDQ